MRARGLFCGAVLATAALFVPHVARADGAPSAERIKSAAAEYDSGRRAFTDGKFEEAAIHFENAYHDAPNAQTLRNAMRARKQAGQLARAATLALLAQSRYSDDDATTKVVKEMLAEARPKLFELTVNCDPDCGVAADGRAVSLEDAKKFAFFLQPGPHKVVVSWVGDRSKELAVSAKEGKSQDFTLQAPPLPPKVVAGGGTGGATGGTTTPPSTKPFGPAVFFVSLGLTAVAGGFLIWSGVDTLNNPGTDAVRQGCVGQGESCPLYQQGLDEQLRTNVLIAVTAGMGAITLVVGAFLTQWSSPKVEQGAPPPATAKLQPTFALGPHGASLGLSGAF